MDTVPETFVDAFGEISLKHGMIRIDLVSLSGSEPRVTQRLITSLQAFSQMLQTQNGMREQLEKAGVLRSQQPSSPGAEPGSQSTSPVPVGEETADAGATVVRLMPQAALPAAATPAATARRRPKSPNFSDEQ
ncbi:hypothetical protein EOA23_06195 [Mesorhizobium sp. M2A.F.Ca.ET.042.01.1.1]|uniref:hypothetical protein n=1 Tax=Mesorhizobium sp. M2A.F.Ca.ET.042.01.1.1 TaxID=2496745 RepID=UPI000FCA6A87|nr:hypothetical protein [Mesorhizobium sp. M2A.F.Ca.ET.042.01.1.1]RUX33582.1 hypothetical protein EOA23_06195 [Mesorhizobium sp. M2A.F.Ca.ET.042.01.1.1]